MKNINEEQIAQKGIEVDIDQILVEVINDVSIILFKVEVIDLHSSLDFKVDLYRTVVARPFHDDVCEVKNIVDSSVSVIHLGRF